ncbi:hypothetical protein [Tepidiforma thermophila]|uniref:ABM domain-containing protein n=1 Tax=Tepidiforma thermophila (strain KCTC 52669 / CGMCC 1.13589 / G233) TaxID=2761530 RepID=A0A2A9HHH1_TEPT2|nr:hypothetical protein [Tepidiforma thermophila]PFG74813.1 hypothetical protein A9A59_2055 [Tepidiforma thermophila]
MPFPAHRYLVQRIRADRQLTPERAAELARQWRESCTANGVVPWGVFAGLLGLRTDELLIVAAAETDDAEWPALPGLAVEDGLDCRPTARPERPEAQSRPGIYVFRTFEIASADVDEFVRLSAEAWQTFEAAPAYRAEPRALLRADLPGASSRMLLVTWYDGLASWERSRQPDPEARANFEARARLTRWALPIATRLV